MGSQLPVLVCLLTFHVVQGCMRVKPTPTCGPIDINAAPTDTGITKTTGTTSTVGGKKVFTCPAGSAIYVDDGETSVGPFTTFKATCNPTSLKWEVTDGTEVVTIENGLEAGCGFRASPTCAVCGDYRDKYDDVYDPASQPTGTVDTYFPPTAIDMCMIYCNLHANGPSDTVAMYNTVTGKPIDSLKCNFNTGKIEDQNGAVVDMWSCVGCACTPLEAGTANLCKPDEFCTDPITETDCTLECTGGKVRYTTAAGSADNGEILQCKGMAWDVANLHPMEPERIVTCVEPKPAQSPTTKFPNLGTIATNPCTTPTDCDATKLKYTEIGGKYYITCESGLLYIGKNGGPEMIMWGSIEGSVTDTEPKVGADTVTTATCRQTQEGGPTPHWKDCLDMAGFGTGATAADFTGSCSYGLCYIKCAGGGNVMFTDGNNMPGSKDRINCQEFDPIIPDKNDIAAGLKCN